MIDYEYIIKVEKKDIDIMNKVIEAYEGIGNIRTISAEKGIVKILTNKYFLSDIDEALNKIKRIFKIDFEIISDNNWKGEV